MPLKHDAETFLVFLLGLMIALAGMTAALLPPITVSILPWAVALGVSILYPLALYPVLKESRADYEFRALHFAPLVVLLLWLVLELIATSWPSLQRVQTVFTILWSLPAVGLFFLLLVLFCLRVLRQRFMRLGLLLTVFVPFLVLAVLSDRFQWDRAVASIFSPTIANLEPSTDTAEERWRVELRRMEQRRRLLAQSSLSGSLRPLQGAVSGTQIAATAIGSRGSGSTSSTPPNLPSAGSGIEVLALTMLALYTGTLHRKVIARR